MSNKKHNYLGTIIATVFSLAVLVLAGWLVLNRQFAFDQWSVWNYQPTPAIATITERAGMTEKGKFYFYASEPAINTAEDFNANCTRQEAKSAILGCYSSGKVFIYDVPNAQLDGIEEVTAAHEMLHAVWERMSESDRQAVGLLLEAEYTKLNDPSLQERMAYYDRNEPGEHLNELHSIIATEFSSISPELEKYYSHLFSDRQKVTTLHATYNQVFSRLTSEAERLRSEVVTLGANIETASATYNTAVDALSSDIASFNVRANEGSFTSVAQFNRERAALVARSAEIDAQRSGLQAQVQSYNQKYAEYQKLSIQSDALNQSIDSTLAPAPSL